MKNYSYYENIVKDWVKKDLIYATETVNGRKRRTGYNHWKRMRKTCIDGFKFLSNQQKKQLKELYVQLMEEGLPPVEIPFAPMSSPFVQH
ncbi:MAG: hypothetical protein Q4A70_00950 [Candidatus Saccharibacteria bacterium]|nr:hypothetical protein [Candidatus Saccharibacteria bacterium]